MPFKFNPFTGLLEPVANSGDSNLPVFYFQNLDDEGSTIYVGKSTTGGEWRIEKTVETGVDLLTTFASETNNVSYTTYDTAWAARTTLTYGDITSI